MSDSFEEQAPRPITSYLFTTVSGAIVLINAFIFILMARESYDLQSSISSALMSAPSEVLLRYGAKEVVLLITGEWWRLFCPIFLHIGLIHFIFNNIFLLMVGPQIEAMFGYKKFILVYLISGIIGNIFSALFNVSISAGSSTSLFGLLGVGFLVERLYARRLQQKAGIELRKGFFTGLVVVNVIIGLSLPFVDNFAHLGGFIGGLLICLVFLYTEKNNLCKMNPLKAKAVGFVIILLLALGGAVMYKPFLPWRIEALNTMTDSIGRYRNNLVYLRVEPDNNSVRYEVARTMLLESIGSESVAYMELKLVASDGAVADNLLDLSKELEDKGFTQRAWQVKRLYEIMQYDR